MNKKVILMILDGWGKSPDPKVSAIDNANTQFIDALYTKYGHAMLRTDGLHVGLPEGQMGNSGNLHRRRTHPPPPHNTNKRKLVQVSGRWGRSGW